MGYRERIQAAIDAAYLAGGGVVSLPPGEFVVGKAPDFAGCLRLRSHVHLRGEGTGSTTIRQAPNLPTFTRLLTNEPGSVGIRVSDLTLDGDRENQEPHEHRHGLFLSDASNVTINCVLMRQFTGDGCYLYNGVAGFTASHCRVEDCSRNGFTVGSGSGTHGLRYESCTVDRVSSTGLDSEPNAGAPWDVSVTGCRLGSEDSPLESSISAAGKDKSIRSRDWRIVGCSLHGQLNLTWLEDSVIEANRITGPGNRPVVYVYRNTHRIVIADNVIRSSGIGGNAPVVEITATSASDQPREILLHGNLISGAGAGNVVRIQGPDSVTVQGNSIEGIGDVPPGVGVYLRPTISVSAATIRGNRISRCRSGVYLTSSGPRVTLLDVSGNQIDGADCGIDFAVKPTYVDSLGQVGNTFGPAVVLPIRNDPGP